MDPPAAKLVDTGYVLAVVNSRDQWYDIATRWRHHLSATRHKLVVTEYVLVEIGNGLSAPRFRSVAAAVIAGLRQSPDVEYVPASADLFDAALGLYQQRPDKDWGLTDCASFWS